MKAWIFVKSIVWRDRSYLKLVIYHDTCQKPEKLPARHKGPTDTAKVELGMSEKISEIIYLFYQHQKVLKYQEGGK